jgi:dTDP-glucose 4,6-dehydratase
MRVLVTGGCGFIGSHYVRGLLDGRFGAPPDLITVYDALTYAGNRANLPAEHPRLRFVHGDIQDAPALDRVLPGHDAVVHFAAETHVDRSLTGPATFVLTNVAGTQTLLEACLRARVRRVLHVSTDEVYGSIPAGSWDEGWPVAPNSPYSASKAAGDLLALAYHRSFGLSLSIVRASNNYGPYQYPEKVIPRFVTNLLTGQPVTLYGDGGNVREWLHVEDCCRGVHLALERGGPGEVYNLGSGEELTNRELTGRLLDLCDAGWDRVTYVADRLAHDRRYSVATDKIRALGWRPRVRLAGGLPEVVRWYRENRWWWEPATTPAVVS